MADTRCKRKWTPGADLLPRTAHFECSLLRLASRADTLFSTATLQVPEWPWIQHIPQLDLVDDTEARRMLSISGSRFGAGCSVTIPTTIKHLIDSMCEMLIAFQQIVRESPDSMESFSVHTLRNWTQHRLLSLPKSPSQVPSHEGCLLELCRLRILLFSNLVIYPLPPAAGVGSKFSLDLRKTIDCITIHDPWPVYPDLLLWSTMLGAISANDGEDQLWYTTKLASRAVLTNTTGWCAAKEIFYSFLWWEGCDSLAYKLWMDAGCGLPLTRIVAEEASIRIDPACKNVDAE